MGKFEISKDKSGEFRFSLKAANGQVILASQGYTTRAACNNGIASVRKNAQHDGHFERKTARDGSPYFNLKATNGQVIGASQMYNNAAGMENGIESIKKNAPEASTEDLTLAKRLLFWKEGYTVLFLCRHTNPSGAAWALFPKEQNEYIAGLIDILVLVFDYVDDNGIFACILNVTYITFVPEIEKARFALFKYIEIYGAIMAV